MPPSLNHLYCVHIFIFNKVKRRGDYGTCGVIIRFAQLDVEAPVLCVMNIV